MNRKAMEVESKRTFILEAARQLFATKGIDNTTMEDIAEASDYTRRTIYSYFKSFDEISLMVFREDQSKRWELQKIAVANADTGLNKLQTWAETLYQFARDNNQYIRMELYWDFRGITPKLMGRKLFKDFEKRNNELADGLREIFRLGIKDKSMRPDLEIDICISQFLYSLRAIINRALSPTYSFTKIDSDKYLNHFVKLFCRSITESEGEMK